MHYAHPGPFTRQPSPNLHQATRIAGHVATPRHCSRRYSSTFDRRDTLRIAKPSSAFIREDPRLQKLLPTREYGPQFIFFVGLHTDEWWPDWATIQANHVHHRFHCRYLVTPAKRVEWNDTTIQQICERVGVASVSKLPQPQW